MVVYSKPVVNKNSLQTQVTNYQLLQSFPFHVTPVLLFWWLVKFSSGAVSISGLSCFCFLGVSCTGGGISQMETRRERSQSAAAGQVLKHGMNLNFRKKSFLGKRNKKKKCQLITMIDAQWSPHMHVIPITCIVRDIQPQIISTLMRWWCWWCWSQCIAMGMLMMMVGGVLMEVRLRSLIYCVCCLPPVSPQALWQPYYIKSRWWNADSDIHTVSSMQHTLSIASQTFGAGSWNNICP